MKKLYSIIALFSAILNFNCEDVIQVDTPQDEPRLIVEALIRVDFSSPMDPLQLKVSITSPFFGEIPATELDQVTMVNVESGGTIVFNELDAGSGIYIADSSPVAVAQVGGEWILQIDWEGKLYLARATFVPTSPIDSLEQGDDTLFNENDTEVIVTFTDNEDRDDFYIFDFDFGEYLTTEDIFYQGQQFSFSYFYDDGLEPGQEVEISILGADRAFFNYMTQLIEQSDDNFNIFATPTATVRGNIINVTDIDNIDFFDNVDQTGNFALGYFAIVEENKSTILIE